MTDVFTIRVLRQGALYSRRDFTRAQAREACSELDAMWPSICETAHKTPGTGRLAILVDDPRGVTHIWASVRGAS